MPYKQESPKHFNRVISEPLDWSFDGAIYPAGNDGLDSLYPDLSTYELKQWDEGIHIVKV